MKCPHCGHPQPASVNSGTRIALRVIVILLGIPAIAQAALSGGVVSALVALVSVGLIYSVLCLRR